MWSVILGLQGIVLKDHTNHEIELESKVIVMAQFPITHPSFFFQFHTLTMYAAFFASIAVAIEGFKPSDTNRKFIRNIAIIIYGSWLIQARKTDNIICRVEIWMQF